LRQGCQHGFQTGGNCHGGFTFVIGLFDLGIAPGPEFRTKLQYRIRMTPIGQYSQLLFDVGVIGQLTFASPVVVPGGFRGEIPDLHSQRASEFVYLAAGKLFVFEDVLPDVRDPVTQFD